MIPYSVYTFNPALKRRIAGFAEKYPAVCRMVSEDKDLGCQSYVIDMARLSIRLTAPYSEERRKAASDRAKEKGINTIFGYYYPTAKNGMVKELFAKFGFDKISEDENGNTVWELKTSGYEPKNRHILVNPQ